MKGLAAVFEALDATRDATGAVTVTATFVTSHGLVQIAAGIDGRAMTVDGRRVPLDQEQAA